MAFSFIESISHTAADNKSINFINKVIYNADFIGCVAFGRSAEFAEKYFRQGTKIAIVGRIQTGSYVNKDGVKVYTTDVVVDEQEFAESKAAASQNSGFGGGSSYQAPEKPAPSAAIGDGFMNIPEGIDEELPFS